MENIITFNTDQMDPPVVGNDLFANRTALAESLQQAAYAEVTIAIQGFNRLNKTKQCVESVLKYTENVDYELLLIDNGSEDDTLDYFRSVPYKKKRILHITKNIGSGFPPLLLPSYSLGKYLCWLPNDLIVTPRWMENLLACMNSDPKIGMVTPVCNNTSNWQDVNLPYKNYFEMQEQAARFNHSDSRKWEDRQRLLTLGTLYRKEVLLADGWPIGDAGFFHDFGDDNITFKIRRLGYRTVLAGDTWVCHDHDLRHGEDKDPAEFRQSLNIGRANFKEKYFGLDAWEDANNYFIPYLQDFPAPAIKGSAKVLGVDVRCGPPILDVKNWLRKFGIFQAELSAFIQDPKYWLDLKTICDGPVICDREEFLSDGFLPGYFDYVIADRPINRYHEPQKVINDLFTLCKSGGVVACKLKNTFSFQEYVHLLGQWHVYDREYAYPLPVDAVNDTLKRLGDVKAIIAIPFDLNEDTRQTIDSLIPAELPERQRTELLKRMTWKEYLFIIQKH